MKSTELATLRRHSARLADVASAVYASEEVKPTPSLFVLCESAKSASNAYATLYALDSKPNHLELFNVYFQRAGTARGALITARIDAMAGATN